MLPPADQVASSRLRLALQMSVQYLPEGLADAAREMLTDPAFYAGLGLGLGLYLAAWLAPEPVFSKGTAILITTALLLMFTVAEIRNVMAVLWRLYHESEAAESLEELEGAAQNFARGASGTVVRVLAAQPVVPEAPRAARPTPARPTRPTVVAVVAVAVQATLVALAGRPVLAVVVAV